MRLFVFACVLACAAASRHWATPVAALASTGTSQSSRTQDAAGNYAFHYNEQHSTGGSSRQESGNGWGSRGSYTLNVNDGRQRTVNYVADGNGFRAAIATNEPGTAAAPAASTAISSPHLPPQPVQPLPVPVVAAPVAVAAPEPVAQWSVPALPALAPAPEPVARWAPAPEPVAHWAPAPIAPVLKPVVKAVAAPAVSSYSTSINHVVPAAAPVAVAVAAPVSHWNAVPALPAAPAPIALHPAPVQQVALKGWK